jgi:hypothetical protein
MPIGREFGTGSFRVSGKPVRNVLAIATVLAGSRNTAPAWGTISWFQGSSSSQPPRQVGFVVSRIVTGVAEKEDRVSLAMTR